MNQPITGSCLCGNVKFRVAGPFSAFRYCFCSRCRKASGSAHAANLVVPRAQFQWTAGESSIRRYDLPDAQRFSVWTCNECGTRVPHVIRTRDDMLVPAGTLDTDPGMKPEHSIFWASKASWYSECGDIPHFTGYAS